MSAEFAKWDRYYLAALTGMASRATPHTATPPDCPNPLLSAAWMQMAQVAKAMADAALVVSDEAECNMCDTPECITAGQNQKLCPACERASHHEPPPDLSSMR